ncbi:ORC2-domain-containing protein [Basidiobolus meristosporus CBS 931.73]|uniref:Origin recognition complex subunit 2 n=1 Tax=Basidiobolus meristosporus CBS 931.73 TaxID=1314790 RepID=A0A1Y1YBI0_9FUNG|nr:ORC2-domain-containing protein [Basidiobolus meristosporus CBS 931.73]|eukprot:ORX94954.1 ORC2-domain-containing protein [Basidiobolus meristosporus CBS 931.73]
MSEPMDLEEGRILPILYQTNDEIPNHIINIVDKKDASKVPKSRRSIQEKEVLKGPKSGLLASLTVDPKKKPSESEIHTIEDDDEIYMPLTTSKEAESTESKTSGKNLFQFSNTQKGRVLGKERASVEPEPEQKTTRGRKAKPAVPIEVDPESNSEPELSDDGEEATPMDNQEGYERYFSDLHGKGGSQTSNNTLSKLPTLEHKDFITALRSVPVKHVQEAELLQSLHEQQFFQWYFELKSGFNILFYGFGSKRKLLNKFAQSYLTDGSLLVVNGYFPTISIKEILGKIIEDVVQKNGSLGSPEEQISSIYEYFTNDNRPIERLYLLIHNIDGGSLRTERVQTLLSVLAAVPNVHLIASVDHINAAMLWDTVKTARFNWVWHDVTTYESYMVETSFENSLMVRQKDMSVRGVHYVLASLTSNAKGIFRVLAEYQISMESDGASGNRHELGLPYTSYYSRCREKFLVSSDLAFRAQLTEFRDHKIIHSKRSSEGTEILYIPMDSEMLSTILTDMP